MATPIVLARCPIKNIYIGKLLFLLKFKPFSLILYMHTVTVYVKIQVLKKKDFDPPNPNNTMIFFNLAKIN